MKKSRAAWNVAVGFFFFFSAATVLANVPPFAECRVEVPVAASQYWFRATQTVVQPWRGPHHVYGVFSVPEQYKRHRFYSARLAIQGFTEEFSETSTEGGEVYIGRAEPGYYLMRVNLSTRTALWFFLTGRFGDLKTPCHWWLVISDRIG